jgi:hypothetical protein
MGGDAAEFVKEGVAPEFRFADSVNPGDNRMEKMSALSP